MGLCSSNTYGKDTQLSSTIDKMLQSDVKRSNKHVKVLLLGAGESGKSTLIRQVVNIHGEGFSEQDLKRMIPAIHSNILESMRTLVEESYNYSTEFPHGGFDIDSTLNRERQFFLSLQRKEEPLTAEIARMIQRLWEDPGIKKTYSKRWFFQLPDNTSYFIGRLPYIAVDSYIPTFDDVLHVRIRSTGIMEHSFQVGNFRLDIFDAGGQRSERRKWIHVFQGVSAVIFVAALSGYNQSLFEDSRTNRLHEALNLFLDVVNSHWLKDATFFLLLNKRDLFEEALKETKLDVCFSDFPGPDTFEECCKYVLRQFLDQHKTPDRPKKIVVHFTTATDAGMMGRVLHEVIDRIIKIALQQAGLY